MSMFMSAKRQSELEIEFIKFFDGTLAAHRDSMAGRLTTHGGNYRELNLLTVREFHQLVVTHSKTPQDVNYLNIVYVTALQNPRLIEEMKASNTDQMIAVRNMAELGTVE